MSVEDTLRPRAALGLLAADRTEFDVTVIVWTALDFLAVGKARALRRERRGERGKSEKVLA